MPNVTVPAAGEAIPAADAAAFCLACWLAGHRAYVGQSGYFAIQISHHARLRPVPEHHLGRDYAWTLGFDDRPFAALFARDDRLGLLIEAARELEAALTPATEGGAS